MPTENSQQEERAELAWVAVEQLQLSIEQFRQNKFAEVEEFYDESMRNMLNQHSTHLDNHVENQTDVDPYKIVSWYGCSLLQMLPIQRSNHNDSLPCMCDIVAKATVETLNSFLYFDSDSKYYFDKNHQNFLVRMLLKEKSDDAKNGIWQNGLYTAFYSGLKVVRQSEP